MIQIYSRVLGSGVALYSWGLEFKAGIRIMSFEALNPHDIAAPLNRQDTKPPEPYSP